jgi:hypothetical protein
VKRLAFVLLSLIFACVTLPPSRSDTYSIVMAPLRRFESETPINCESNDLWYSWELSKAFVKLDNSLDHARFTASMNFEIADSALKNGCLDFADKAYREIIVIYIGTAYAASATELASALMIFALPEPNKKMDRVRSLSLNRNLLVQERKTNQKRTGISPP